MESELLAYSQLENGIYQMEIKKASRAAVDAWIEKLNEIYLKERERDLFTDEPSRVLIQFCEETLPIAYSLNVIRKWASQRPPTKRKTIVALVYGGNLLQMVDTMVRTLRIAETMRIFPFGKTGEALRWLDQVGKS
jgi:hypothetical protein